MLSPTDLKTGENPVTSPITKAGSSENPRTSPITDASSSSATSPIEVHPEDVIPSPKAAL